MNATVARLVDREDWNTLKRMAKDWRARRRRVAVKAKPAKQAKEAKREEARQSTTDLRARLVARARGRCEICDCREAILRHPLEMHHVLSAANRKRKEAEDTCLMICSLCHVGWHRYAQAHTFKSALRSPHLNAEAKRAIERRLAKIEAARVPEYRRGER